MFETARWYKPFPGFEAKYQGVPVINPVAIPGTFDFQAGKPGYSPNLLAGIPVTLGSKLLLWLPRFINDYGVIIPDYTYTLCFRLRTIDDKNADPAKMLSYHLDQRLPGLPNDPAQPETTKRFVIPASQYTISTQQLDSVAPSGKLTIQGANVVVKSTSVNGDYWTSPLTENYPGGPFDATGKVGFGGVWSQGQFEDEQGFLSVQSGYKNGPSYANVEFMSCPGDELMINVSRTGDPWDFASDDAAFSKIFGTDNGARQPLPNSGVAVMCGE